MSKKRRNGRCGEEEEEERNEEEEKKEKEKEGGGGRGKGGRGEGREVGGVGGREGTRYLKEVTQHGSDITGVQ